MYDFASVGIHVRGTGDVKTVCPKCSAERKNHHDPCLSVNVDEGVWKCHHCGWSGGMKTKSHYVRPEYKHRDPNKAEEWFTSRGISMETVNHFHVSLTDRGTGIMFPYYKNGELVNYKARSIVEKRFTQAKDAEPTFFNVDALTDCGVIVEGEMDVLALYEAGITNAISVPGGAPNEGDKSADGKLKCLETCAKEIEKVKAWTIFVDNDANGKRLQAELIRRLGAENCSVVQWDMLDGCKDANDVLLKYGKSELSLFVKMAKPCPVDGEHRFSEYKYALDMKRRGEPLYKVYGSGYDWFENYKVAPGFITTVTGIPSSGKSTFVANMVCRLAINHGLKFGMFCPENPGRSMLEKLVQAAVQKPLCNMTDGEYERAISFVNDHFMEIIGVEDKISRTVENILRIATSYVKRYGINGLVIDAYSRLQKDFGKESETLFVSRLLDELSAWAKRNECHVWIVAHPRIMNKGNDGKYTKAMPYDISGSAHWFNGSDMILSVYRHLDESVNHKVTVYVMKVKEEPELGEIGSCDFTFDRNAGIYKERTII